MGKGKNCQIILKQMGFSRVLVESFSVNKLDGIMCKRYVDQLRRIRVVSHEIPDKDGETDHSNK